DTRAQRWTSTEALWKWVDTSGKALGIGRPYLGRDPPHVGPIDGPEYISRRGGATTQQAAGRAKKGAARKTHKPAQIVQARGVRARVAQARLAQARDAQAKVVQTKPRSAVAAHEEHSAPKRPKTSARSSKVRTS